MCDYCHPSLVSPLLIKELLSVKSKRSVSERGLSRRSGLSVIFGQDLFTGVTRGITSCGKEGGRVEVGAGFEVHFWTI
jgi:hypothetical protein